MNDERNVRRPSPDSAPLQRRLGALNLKLSVSLFAATLVCGLVTGAANGRVDSIYLSGLVILDIERLLLCPLVLACSVIGLFVNLFHPGPPPERLRQLILCSAATLLVPITFLLGDVLGRWAVFH
ncbi:MAG TPA: hypothetical protein VFJ58_02005 [Armatimonadota bacterium]|nr:hypothetical protein [Armatimonadota bacterium]